MNNPLIALIDIDNVILDTERAILNRHNRQYQKEVKFEEIDRWDFFNDKVDSDFFNFLMKDEFWLNEVQPIKPMCDYVKELLSRPDLFDVKLVTATNPLNPALKAKLECAIKFTRINPKNVFVCNDKSLLHGDIIIDDYTENIRYSNCWNNWLVDRPWNKATGYWDDCVNDVMTLSAPYLHDLEEFANDLGYLKWCDYGAKRTARIIID